MNRKSILSSIILLLIVITLQTTSRGNQPVFAEGNYPHLGQAVPINVPDCTPNASTAVVSNNTQIDTAVANSAIKVICLNPGSYSEIKLDLSGTEQSPRYIIPNHPTGAALPKPWNQPQNQRVKVNKLIFTSNYWRVIGINIVSDAGLILEIRQGFNNNVADNVLVEGLSERIQPGAGDRSMTRIRETAFYNHIQNSVLRNPPRVPGDDSHCLVIRDSRHNTIINNQFYDCPGDGIQITTFPTPNWDNRGNKIINNELYLTDRLYADCSDASIDANLNGSGECACAENALDIKYNVDTPVANNQDKFEIRGNELYGFRKTHQACGGSGDMTAPAIYLQNVGTQDILIEGNVLANSDTGVQFKDTGSGGPDNISFLNNLLYNIRLNAAIQIAAGKNNTFTHNTVVLTLNDQVTGRHSIRLSGNAQSALISNNLFLSSNVNYRGFTDLTDTSGFNLQNNGYVQMATPITGLPGVNDMQFPNDPLSNYAQHCFNSQKHTAGVPLCYLYLEPGFNAATVDTINSAVYGLDYDFYYRPRTLPYDIGATEVPFFDFFSFLPGVVK